MMANDIQKMADALLDMIVFEDVNKDGRYDKKIEKFQKMGDGLYEHLDSYDKVVGNGFTKKDVMSFFTKEGIAGLKRFYPNFNFEFDNKCGVLWPNIDRKSLLRYNEGDINPTDPRVQSILKEKGIPSLTVRPDDKITYVSYVPGAPTIIVHEDNHENTESAKCYRSLLDQIMSVKKNIVIFKENLAGPIVMGKKSIEGQWNHVKDLLANYKLRRDEFRKELPKFDNYGYLENLLKTITDKLSPLQLFALNIDGLASWLKVTPDVIDAFVAIAPMVYARALYGDKVLVVNLESHLPTTFEVLQKSPDVMIKEVISTRSFLNLGNDEIKPEECRAQRFSAMFKMGSDLKTVKNVFSAIDKRSVLWAGNLKSLAGDASYKGERIFLVSGGSMHLPKLEEELSGKFSIISIRAKALDKILEGHLK